MIDLKFINDIHCWIRIRDKAHFQKFSIWHLISIQAIQIWWKMSFVFTFIYLKSWWYKLWRERQVESVSEKKKNTVNRKHVKIKKKSAESNLSWVSRKLKRDKSNSNITPSFSFFFILPFVKLKKKVEKMEHNTHSDKLEKKYETLSNTWAERKKILKAIETLEQFYVSTQCFENVTKVFFKRNTNSAAAAYNKQIKRMKSVHNLILTLSQCLRKIIFFFVEYTVCCWYYKILLYYTPDMNSERHKWMSKT